MRMWILTTRSLLLLVLGLGCETDFEPFAENSEVFSVIGYLDTERDSQFVRVEVLQDGIFFGGPRDPLDDVEVVLEHLSTGQRFAMQDSISWFSGATVHNFWTPLRPKVGESYRITVTHRDGGQSSARVLMPSAFPTPAVGMAPACLLSGCDPTPLPVSITGVERLVAVIVTYTYQPLSGNTACGRVRVAYTNETTRTADAYRTRIDWLRDLQAENLFRFETIDLLVVSGDSEWPDVTVLDEEALFLPQFVSNIDNGVGFFGGVTRKSMSLFDTGICR